MRSPAFWSPAAIFTASMFCLAAANARADEIATGEPSSPAAPLVSQALRSELAGDAATRAALLEKAIAADRDYAPAHWHAGHVFSGGAWKHVEESQRQAVADQRYQKYRFLRQERAGTLAGEIYLARWCRKNSLSDEAAVHWRFVLGLQSKNQEAMDALGVSLYEARHLTAEQIAREEAVAAKQAEADQRWRRQTIAWREAFERGDASKAEALGEIAAVDDAAAIPWLQSEIAPTGRDATGAVVDALARMDHRDAAPALVRYAVLSLDQEIRAAAARGLKGRPLNTLAPQLLDALSMPLESSFTLLSDGAGGVFYRHELYREGLASDIAHSVTRQLSQETAIPRRGGYIRPETVALAARVTAANANLNVTSFANSAYRVEQQVSKTNEAVEERNRRITEVLRVITGQNFGNNPRDWWNWWANHNELYLPEYRPVYETTDQKFNYVRWQPQSCFAQGTPVWTTTGLTPIERIQFSDLVLSQNVETGELTWKPVLQITQRPPSPMRELTIGGDAIFATRGHPFWVNAHGWRMTKQLEPGFRVHTIHGPETVLENADRVEMPAYNLVVADFSTYLVGKSGVLVHDNSLALPTTGVVPGWNGMPDKLGSASK